MSERYGKGMRHCCDSPAQPIQKHIKGCVNEEKANLPDDIDALSAKNEEQALAIRELVEVLERLSTFEAFTTEGWGFSHPEIVARVDFARAAIAKAKP